MILRAKQEIIRHNRQEYADAYASMKWLTPQAAWKSTEDRQSLIDAISSHAGAQWAFCDTKLFTHALSPGCSLCGQGTWSCLFVNGICNARCFYCPSSQDDPGPPMTNTLVFDKAADYADYVNRFGIRGVSFSGGEPLLTFERVLSYLEAVKRRADHRVYTWMYTNGMAATRDKLAALRDRGLDEIRFDISADRYRLDGVKKALGVIPTVTVEIPAIPEDLPVMKKVIDDLAGSGVNYLNLHQIRCTPYNSGKLRARGYTFVHGPKVTVLETELAALELIRYSLERSIHLPINYCSHAYQHQFQAAGARRRCAGFIKAGCEDITPTGHIRRLTLAGPEKTLADISHALAARGSDPSRYSLSTNRASLSVAAGLWPWIDWPRVRLKVGYSQAVLQSGVSYRHPFRKVALNGNKTIVVEKQTILPGVWLDGEAVRAFGSIVQAPEASRPRGAAAAGPFPGGDALRSCEAFIPDLAPYF